MEIWLPPCRVLVERGGNKDDYGGGDSTFVEEKNWRFRKQIVRRDSKKRFAEKEKWRFNK